MGHTNSTVNYNLPQFVGTDKPSWLGDVNGAFLAIDTAIAAAKTEADSAAGGVASLQNTVGSHTTQIGTLTDTVTAQGGTLNSVTALIGNGTPTTTDQTIIGAINEINAKIETYSTEITADGVKTYSQVLDLLHAQIDSSKVSPKTTLVETRPNGTVAYLQLNVVTASGAYRFTRSEANSTGLSSITYDVATSGSTAYGTTGTSTPAINVSNDSSAVMQSGMKLKVLY